MKLCIDSNLIHDLPKELGEPIRVATAEAENTSFKCVVSNNLMRDLPKELGERVTRVVETKAEKVLLNILLTATQCVTCPKNWGIYGNAGN